MNLLLSNRDTDLTERMDDPQCNHQHLLKTYANFRRVNRDLSQWKRLYRTYLRPLLKAHPQLSILDLGCGGGDIAFQLMKYSQEDGLTPRITGADPDERAIRFAQQQYATTDLKFIQASSTDLILQNLTYDVVISNHVLHHLMGDQLARFCNQARSLSRRRVLFNDILRHDMAWLLFQLYTMGRFKQSFIREDGLTSIRRSFTPAELEKLLDPSWTIKRLFPFRLIVTCSTAQA
ncbi:MAG: methyltransferase domain-containing protein [Bacteroidota bacterium]